MTEQSKWVQMTTENPEHSTWYVQRFRQMAAEGADLVGEARFVDGMVPRGARVLDAGCGPGRHGGYLSTAGREVDGVDIDPVLIWVAEEDFTRPTCMEWALAQLDSPERGNAGV